MTAADLDGQLDAPALVAAARLLAERTGLTIALVPIADAGRAADSVGGQHAAGKALGASGFPYGFDGRHRDDGRPIWPAEYTGSIAHAGAIAAAAVLALPRRAAVRQPARGVGIDIEIECALPAADATAVLGHGERALVIGADRPDALATMLWSAKEAAYKAWCEALDGHIGTVDPVDIQIEIGAPVDGLQPILARPRGALATTLAGFDPAVGWCAAADGYVLVAVSVGAAPRHGDDGIASEAITSPSAANATT